MHNMGICMYINMYIQHLYVLYTFVNTHIYYIFYHRYTLSSTCTILTNVPLTLPMRSQCRPRRTQKRPQRARGQRIRH